MFKRILIPVDGSEPSKAAVAFGIRFAADQGAQLAFVHAYDVARIVAMTSGGGTACVDPTVAIEAERSAGETILHEAVTTQCLPPGTAAFLEEGSCVSAILNVAQAWNADLIVIGSHGRGGIARALLGSFVEGVMRRAGVPVLVMHIGEALPAEQQGSRRAPATSGAVYEHMPAR